MYLEGSFPPADYQGFSFRSLETSISQELRSRAGDAYERASAFVYFWGIILGGRTGSSNTRAGLLSVWSSYY